MATVISDLDGTALVFGTNKFVPGALESFKKLAAEGHQIIFITRRPAATNVGLKDLLQKAIGSQVILITGVQGPRIIIDDTPPGAIWHTTNDPWNYDLTGLGKS